MKAMAYSNPGPPEVLQLHEVARPAPKDHEVLIRIHATTATAGDCEARRSKAPGAYRLLRPRQPGIVILGQELAGEVEAVGRKVARFRKGDQIVAWSGLRLGTYAEYICLPERGVLFAKPTKMTFEEAATLPVGGLDAVYLLRKANSQRGEKALINGAGGSMGTYAVQIARHFGAEVTGVDSTAKLDMLRSIGADHVIDYTQEDFIQSGKTYDVIFDVIGTSSFSDILNCLNRNGRYVTAVPQMSQIFRGPWTRWKSGKRVIFWMPRTVNRHTDDFAFLKDLIEAGTVKAIIDKCFSFEQAAEAHRYIEGEHKQGHVVITFRF
jgi:NADPH:quinone reductase-like Zn-dependent oxidoreductase